MCVFFLFFFSILSEMSDGDDFIIVMTKEWTVGKIAFKMWWQIRAYNWKRTCNFTKKISQNPV